MPNDFNDPDYDPWADEIDRIDMTTMNDGDWLAVIIVVVLVATFAAIAGWTIWRAFKP